MVNIREGIIKKVEYVHIKHWRPTELVIFMDGCNAVKLWEQHKFHENIINEHPIYSHVKIWMWKIYFCCKEDVRN